MITYLKLIVQRVDLSNPTSIISFLLEKDKKIIEKKITKLPIKEGLDKIFTQYLKSNPAWINYKILNIEEEDNILKLIYFVVIPDAVENKKGKWFYINEINNDMVKKLLYQVSTKMHESLYEK